MITSWSWVLLTDFASFKPIFLPEDNPADFSYFFDTSRRRACYIAPERFKTRTLSLDTNTSLWSSTANLGTQSGVSLLIFKTLVWITYCSQPAYIYKQLAPVYHSK
jgi:hypothetical protein